MATTAAQSATLDTCTVQQHRAGPVGDQSQPANQFPKEDFIRGFKNQVDGQGISPLQAEAYSLAAERLARNAFRGGDGRRLLPVKPTSADDRAAAVAFVEQFGLKCFRRPLSDSEVAKYSALLIKNAVAADGKRASVDDFQTGAGVVVEAMLQSPHFLYRRASAADRAQADSRLDAYATASRLAYILWDTMPDEQLFAAAANDALKTREQIESQIRRMLADPKSDHGTHEFLSQWLRFDRVLSATRDRRRYREFNAEIAGAMVEETQRLFDHLVKNDKNFMEFFTADYTFINAPLARLYGLPEPANDFERVDYPVGPGVQASWATVRFWYRRANLLRLHPLLADYSCVTSCWLKRLHRRRPVLTRYCPNLSKIDH